MLIDLFAINNPSSLIKQPYRHSKSVPGGDSQISKQLAPPLRTEPVELTQILKDNNEPILNADGTFKFIPDADSFDEKQQAKY